MLISVHEFIPYFAVETGSEHYLKHCLYSCITQYWGVKLPFYLLHPIQEYFVVNER